ncbi:MAG: AraC family transcriptional regulator [Chitinophagaceae bacterium]|nr:AraC family transcriptional regulator [Chitinophagaceae bacterium]
MPDSIGKLSIDERIYDLRQLSEIPDEFKNFRIKGSTIKYAHGHFGKVLYQQIDLGDFKICYSIYRIKEDCTCLFTSKKQYLGIHIVLKNDPSYSIRGLGTIVFKEAQCNLFYLPFINTVSGFQKGKEYVCFDVFYRANHIKQYAALFPFVKLLTAKIKNRSAFAVYKQPSNISFAIRQIVDEALHSNYQVELQKIYLRIKASELLFNIMALPSGDKDSKMKFNENDITKLHETKTFIEANYEHHYSISKIAKMSGMNTTTFKIGFCHEFRMGPFEFLVKTRMAKAGNLVKERSLAINQIADATGYKSSGSFIKAFKKYFDITPGQMRKTFT